MHCYAWYLLISLHIDYNAACAVLQKIGINMTHVAPSEMQQQGKLAKPIKDKASTTQGDSGVASSKCRKTTVLLSVSMTALLLFQVVYVVVSITKLSALEEELTQLRSSSKSGILLVTILKLR